MLSSVAIPTLREAAQSRMAEQSAPDWESTEIPPAFGMWLAKDGIQLVVGVDQTQTVGAQ